MPCEHPLTRPPSENSGRLFILRVGCFGMALAIVFTTTAHAGGAAVSPHRRSAMLTIDRPIVNSEASAVLPFVRADERPSTWIISKPFDPILSFLADLPLHHPVPFSFNGISDVPKDATYGMDKSYEMDGHVRAFYENDQRLQWTGQEATFGVEGVVVGRFNRRVGEWETGLLGEFFLNQPFDRNILADTPERVSYRANFEVEPFETSQLLLTAHRGNVLLAFGKMVTPFGRAYFPLYQNRHQDVPFIRSEAILWRETGFLIQKDFGILMLTTALTNGNQDRDTNSSKALVARAGIHRGRFSGGTSIKLQDGIGSEGQKLYNAHVGLDAILRYRRLTLSGEAIHDEYGFRDPGFDPLNITWGRSLYDREQNKASQQPITGVGYYVNMDVPLLNWMLTFNYGEFHPEKIGNPLHDVPNRRGLIKAAYHFNEFLQNYTSVLVENSVAHAQNGHTRKGLDILTGFQFDF